MPTKHNHGVQFIVHFIVYGTHNAFHLSSRKLWRSIFIVQYSDSQMCFHILGLLLYVSYYYGYDNDSIHNICLKQNYRRDAASNWRYL